MVVLYLYAPIQGLTGLNHSTPQCLGTIGDSYNENLIGTSTYSHLFVIQEITSFISHDVVKKIQELIKSSTYGWHVANLPPFTQLKHEFFYLLKTTVRGEE